MNMTKYQRKFPCAVCKKDVTYTKLANGWLVSCGCGDFMRADIGGTDNFIVVEA